MVRVPFFDFFSDLPFAFERDQMGELMGLKPGSRVWLPCEVAPGPFGDERLVRVEHEGGVWVGFVPVDSLENHQILEGMTRVVATVVQIQGGKFNARIPGHAITPEPFLGLLDRTVPPRAALEA